MSPALSSIAGTIATLAPTLASMLGGPLAGTAVTALEGVLGLKPGAGADQVAKTLQAASLTPEQVVAMKAEDDAHAEKMAQSGIDLTKVNNDFQSHLVDADVSDRSNARLRESNVRDLTPKLLAALITVGFFGVMGAVAFAPMQADAKEPILLLLGSLSTAWTAVVSYYFGSSSGAARGQELLAQSGPISTSKPIELTSK